MNDSIATVTEHGEFIINADNKHAIDLFTIASKGIEALPDSIYREMVLKEAGSVLTEIHKTPNQAARTFKTLFGGMVAFNRKRMLWDLAWAISCVMVDTPSVVRIFFNDGRAELLNKFENHPRLADYVYTYCRTRERTAVRRPNADAKSATRDIGKMADSCIRQMQVHTRTLNKYQDNVEREKSYIEKEYKSCISQIAEAAQAALDDMAGKLEKANKELEKTTAALTSAEEELIELKSKDYIKEVGEQYLTQLIDEYISPYEESDDGEERKKIYNELWNFVSNTSGVPKGILTRVKRLRMPLKKKPIQPQSVYIDKVYGTATGDVIQSFDNEGDKLIES